MSRPRRSNHSQLPQAEKMSTILCQIRLLPRQKLQNHLVLCGASSCLCPCLCPPHFACVHYHHLSRLPHIVQASSTSASLLRALQPTSSNSFGDPRDPEQWKQACCRNHRIPPGLVRRHLRLAAHTLPARTSGLVMSGVLSGLLDCLRSII